MPSTRIAAILTCHNRRDKTVACLESLRSQILAGWNPAGVGNSSMSNEERDADSLSTLDSRLSPSSTIRPQVSGFGPQVSSLSSNRYAIDVFLTDDGCTDGTSDAVLKTWPETTIIQGDGNLFWCGGMRLAWKEAAKSDPDYYLLLNDDTTLYPNAIEHLLRVCPAPSLDRIAVGAVCDPITREWSYGGLQSDHEFPMPDGHPRQCRTMNTNCALIPRAVCQRIGIFYHAYRHAMGDMDYGLVATRAEIALLETPEFVGQCSRNPTRGTWKDTNLSRAERFRKLLSVKGLPPRDWLAYCTRNCGGKWPRYFFSPLLRILAGR